MLTVASVNVNGVRAAVRRGMARAGWPTRSPDVLCLQEVAPTTTRSPRRSARLAHGARGGVGQGPRRRRGREPRAAGRRPRRSVAPATPVGRGFDGAGRWVEADLATGDGPLTVVSAYVHTGEAARPRQAEKMPFLAAVGRGSTRARRGRPARAAHRRPQRRAPRGRPQELEGQPREVRLPAAGARLVRPAVRRAGLGRRRPRAARRRGRARTRGGRGGARPSTSTPAGGSTTRSRHRASAAGRSRPSRPRAELRRALERPRARRRPLRPRLRRSRRRQRPPSSLRERCWAPGPP